MMSELEEKLEAIIQSADALAKASKAAEEWIAGYGQDHIPNDVFERGGLKCMDDLRDAIAAYEKVLGK